MMRRSRAVKTITIKKVTLYGYFKELIEFLVMFNVLVAHKRVALKEVNCDVIICEMKAKVSHFRY